MLRRLQSFAHLPVTRKDGLESKDIQTAFNHVSRVITEKFPGQSLRIMVAGGACSVMLLKNRDRTKDIDFFIPNADCIEMIAGSQSSLPKHLEQRWPRNWINAEMAGFVMMPGCENVYENSIANNEIIYQSESLVVYAADWKYQLITKIIRAYQMEVLKEQVQSKDREGKDLNDAVSILRLLIQRNGENALDRNIVRSWYHGSSLETHEFEFVNDAYRTQFGIDAFV